MGMYSFRGDMLHKYGQEYCLDGLLLQVFLDRGTWAGSQSAGSRGWMVYKLALLPSTVPPSGARAVD